MTAAAMPADQFWRIIERAAKSDDDPAAHIEILRQVLRELSAEGVVSFEVAFRRLARRYPNLWRRFGAAPLG